MEILISLIVGLGLMELYAWLDPFANWLVRWAAKRLPAERDADFIAQWEGDLATVPNSILKVCFVLRDCVLPIKTIQQAMFREEIAQIADSFEEVVEKAQKAHKRVEDRSRTLVQRSEHTRSKLIVGLSEALERLQELQNGDEAQNAIDRLRTLSPPAAEKLSA
jgi:hypothetical protein